MTFLEAMNSINVQVGTGPFILTKWEPDVSVSYDMNPDYWGTDDQGNQVPFVDSITLFGMNDERLQDAGFRTGETRRDWAGNLFVEPTALLGSEQDKSRHAVEYLC